MYEKTQKRNLDISVTSKVPDLLKDEHLIYKAHLHLKHLNKDYLNYKSFVRKFINILHTETRTISR